MKLKNILLLAVAVPLLCACSCQQRIERLQRSCPECFAAATVIDTVHRPAVRLDTMLPIRWEGPRQAVIDQPVRLDTRQGQLRIDIIDTQAAIHLDLPPDTVILQRQVPVPIVREKATPRFRWHDYLLLAALLVLQVFLICSPQH